jgi:hypothetical protein
MGGGETWVSSLDQPIASCVGMSMATTSNRFGRLNYLWSLKYLCVLVFKKPS